MEVFVAIVLFPLLIWLIGRQISGDGSIEKRGKPKAKAKATKVIHLDDLAPHKFEERIADLMNEQGYKTEVTPGSNDFGVDVIARKDGTRYAVQIKRYSKPVSRTAVSDAVAGKDYYNCDAAMVVTNSYFTGGAVQFAEKTKCELVDRDGLKEWLTRMDVEAEGLKGWIKQS